MTMNMTTKLWISSMAMVAALSASSVMADEPAAQAASPSSAHTSSASIDGDKHPCRKLEKEAIDACKAAGFEKGKKGKRLFEDCVKPLHHGKTVEGVTVDQGLVQACQAKKEKHKEKEAAKEAAGNKK